MLEPSLVRGRLTNLLTIWFSRRLNVIQDYLLSHYGVNVLYVNLLVVSREKGNIIPVKYFP